MILLKATQVEIVQDLNLASHMWKWIRKTCKTFFRTFWWWKSSTVHHNSRLWSKIYQKQSIKPTFLYWTNNHCNRLLRLKLKSDDYFCSKQPLNTQSTELPTRFCWTSCQGFTCPSFYFSNYNNKVRVINVCM